MSPIISVIVIVRSGKVPIYFKEKSTNKYHAFKVKKKAFGFLSLSLKKIKYAKFF